MTICGESSADVEVVGAAVPSEPAPGHWQDLLHSDGQLASCSSRFDSGAGSPILVRSVASELKMATRAREARDGPGRFVGFGNVEFVCDVVADLQLEWDALLAEYDSIVNDDIAALNNLLRQAGVNPVVVPR